MESLSGPASGGRETGTSGDGVEDHGYPVDFSCPSTSLALSIPKIREEIVNLSMSPLTMSSFCNVRAVGRAWQETAFDAIKKRNMEQLTFSDYRFRTFFLPLSRDIFHVKKTKRFLGNITPDALLPLVPVFNINRLVLRLATRLVEGYSHVFVGLDLSIKGHGEAVSDLDKKLEVFQGRDYCRLQTVQLRVDGGQASVKQIQKGLDAIERLTASFTKLTQFEVRLSWHFAREDQLVLPSRTTELTLSGRYSLQALVNPRNTLPLLKRLRFEGIELEPETKLRNFLERSTKLEQLRIDGNVPPLNEAPLSLPLTQLKSLKEITLMGLNYAVETTSGSDVIPNLRTAKLLYIELNLEEGEVARLGVLGRLLRNATRFTLYVTTSQIALSRMEPLSECFSNVTRLDWTSRSGWETLVLPLSHVFLRMTCLQRICVTSSDERSVDEPPLDLFRFLTGLQESEIPEEEKTTILNGRKDVVTNLRRLRSLEIWTENQFEPVSPFLFEAIFNSMPELIEIEIYSWDSDPFINVQEMVTAWRASGKQISHDLI